MDVRGLLDDHQRPRQGRRRRAEAARRDGRDQQLRSVARRAVRRLQAIGQRSRGRAVRAGGLHGSESDQRTACVNAIAGL